MNSRREWLRVIVAAPLTKLVPLLEAQHIHARVERSKAASIYAPKYFSARQYDSIQALCEAIIPDAGAGGAIEGGAPEFIDLLTSENEDYQRRLGGGLMWLDAACGHRYGKAFLDCSHTERKDFLDLIAYRRNGKANPALTQGIAFFAFLRDLTLDSYFTSAAGIRYLHYIGNSALKSFPGCPPIPET